MSAACAGKFWLWGWIGGALRGIRDLFRKKERRRKVSVTTRLEGSVKRKVADGLEMFGAVLFPVEKRIDVRGENFTGIVLLLMDEECSLES